MVYRLEQLGLIERSVNGADRRARVLRLSAAGRALHDRQLPKALAAQERILAVLKPAERRALIAMLVRVIEANQSYVRPGAGRRKPVRKNRDAILFSFKTKKKTKTKTTNLRRRRSRFARS
jgi:hypothetical protein